MVGLEIWLVLSQDAAVPHQASFILSLSLGFLRKSFEVTEFR